MKNFTLTVLFLATSLAYAENYRITNPEAWEAVKTADAIKALYGTNTLI